ncbi:putative membrane protein [Nitrobacter sp. Nb-311A]|uniref:DUF1538 domain-containing protein n=1 Tax=unclassified Nitrobacter TaxID=2620411 RepID=UPI000068660F|nr:MULTISPECIES: DUF1538 domain-containing protein [unclassified Nitrobacter]EAQ36010.1 putative membrane protein [Nitrobacter sp. Nb-311A]MCB1393349.1 DUF1538 domain-containing protein [Nitrobacter sp.]MCV0385835.1 DUF1538 domain-containing protein [Nitrobacter sp.]
MLTELRRRLLEVLRSLWPLLGLICLLQIVLVQAPAALFIQFLAGSMLVILGLLLLFLGVDFGILPMGRFIGAEMPRKGSIALIISVGFAMGLATTIAEPDVLVLARQIDEISQKNIDGTTVLYVIGIGVALCTALAMARIVYGISLRLLLTCLLVSVILLSFLAPAAFVPLAYDAGSVTTGVLTAPVIIAVAVGLSSVLAGRSAVSDGFGLLGLASIGPIIAILIMGVILK